MSPGGLLVRWTILWGAVALFGALLARRWLDVVEVRGRSMVPTLLPGDRLLVVRRAHPPRVGDVVLAADPRDARRELIKRVSAVEGATATLHGDNAPASTDTRTFGPVPADRAGWRAVARYWPPGRIGAIPPAPARVGPIEEGGDPACAFPGALVSGA